MDDKTTVLPETVLPATDPHSNQFPINASDDPHEVDGLGHNLGMADVATEDGEDSALNIITDIDSDEGAGMKDGGLPGSRSIDR